MIVNRASPNRNMMGEMIRVSGRAPDVGDILKEAMLSQRFADVALCCPGGQRFLAHRLVLSAASPYLQKVLLAHSKTIIHCEPITVILAEMEGPELAALLGFVYTGNATVPRMRLNAFLRAAETLRIQLPPVSTMTTHGERPTDYKLDETIDVKISPKYLQCEQYPWHLRPSYEDPLDRRRSSCIRIFPTSSEIDRCIVFRDAKALDDINNPGPSFPTPKYPSAWRIDDLLYRDRSMDNDPNETNSTALADKNPAIVPSRGESSFNVYQRGAYHPVGSSPVEGYGYIDPSERSRTGCETAMRMNCSTDGRSTTDDENVVALDEPCRTRDECPYRDAIPLLSSSLQHVDVTAGRTKTPDYASTTGSQASNGEDLSCGESCCRWRTVRRHVANRVTASPWRQIVRPHHSPRPHVTPQRHIDDEIQSKCLTQEVTRTTVISMSPRIRSPRSAPRNDELYTFEVPIPCEMNLNNDARTRETIDNSEANIREIYRSPVTANQIPEFAKTSESNDESPFRNIVTSKTPARSLSNVGNDSVIANDGKSGGYPTIAQTSQTKSELSHPISRLCNTIESDEKKEITRTEMTNADANGDDKIARIFINSDNNNNNETLVSAEMVQRGRSTDDHRCNQCGKTFVTRASLKVHSRTHSGEKPFRCADCGKQFSQLRNYKYHRSVHEGTREFAATCPECGKYFNDRGYLSSHMKIHRNRKEYGCAECGKSFNQRVAYNMHVRIHTGVKPHQCEQCGKAFSRKMLLKQHLRTHSGERPYQCQVCQKAFADRSNMTLHTRLHSGLKPYQCTLCAKAFTKKHHLKTHLNYHTGTKPYSCANCGSRFSQSSNMRTHFKKCIVNNAAGTNGRSGDEAGVERADGDGNITPQIALTPPNSDQESSILTPISKSVVATTDGKA